MREINVVGDRAPRRRETASPAPEKVDLGCASKIVSGSLTRVDETVPIVYNLCFINYNWHIDSQSYIGIDKYCIG